MSAFQLKLIALAAMLLDHIAAVFPEYFPFEFRAIGRLAWPIFAYLAAAGFRHSKAPENFLLRLLTFAIISEIPYDLAFSPSINFVANSNIFYTLFLGGAAIFLYKKYSDKFSQTTAYVVAIFPTALLAEILTADYGGPGVLFVFAMYAIQPKIPRLIAMGVFGLSRFLPLVAARFSGVPREYWIMLPAVLATVPLIAAYNGKRGINAKWLFYAAYPAHLAVLAAFSK